MSTGRPGIVLALVVGLLLPSSAALGDIKFRPPWGPLPPRGEQPQIVVSFKNRTPGWDSLYCWYDNARRVQSLGYVWWCWDGNNNFAGLLQKESGTWFLRSDTLAPRCQYTPTERLSFTPQGRYSSLWAAWGYCGFTPPNAWRDGPFEAQLKW